MSLFSGGELSDAVMEARLALKGAIEAVLGAFVVSEVVVTASVSALTLGNGLPAGDCRQSGGCRPERSQQFSSFHVFLPLLLD